MRHLPAPEPALTIAARHGRFRPRDVTSKMSNCSNFRSDQGSDPSAASLRGGGRAGCGGGRCEGQGACDLPPRLRVPCDGRGRMGSR